MSIKVAVSAGVRYVLCYGLISDMKAYGSNDDGRAAADAALSVSLFAKYQLIVRFHFVAGL